MVGALAGPVLLVVAAAVLWAAAGDIPIVPVPGQLGPDFWPRLGIVGLVAASLLKVVQIARSGGSVTGAAARPPLHLPRLVAGVGLLVLYALLAPLIGFPLATVLFLTAFMLVGGMGRPVAAVGWAVALTVAFLYLFVRVVYLPLPRGGWLFHDLTIALYRLLRLI